MHEPGAREGAMASECAADQNAFWPYHDRLFDVATAQGQSGYSFTKFVQYAEELELNIDDFSLCMTSLQHQASIQQSVNDAMALKLSSTPSVLVNGDHIADPFDYAAIKDKIEALMSEGGG